MAKLLVFALLFVTLVACTFAAYDPERPEEAADVGQVVSREGKYFGGGYYGGGFGGYRGGFGGYRGGFGGYPGGFGGYRGGFRGGYYGGGIF